MPNGKPWTKREERLLVKWRGMGMRFDEIGELLERTDKSVKSRWKLLGFTKDRSYTQEQIARAKEMRGKFTHAQIAAEIGKSLAGVYQLFRRLGLPRLTRVFDRPAIHAWIRVKHPEQWSDSEIANGWNELHPDAPLDRRCITLLRNEIGLPPWHSQTERYRRRVAAKTKEQLAKAGLPTIGHLRRQAYAEWCAQAGWPGITRPRLAQILNLLYERGPHTREQIAKAIGMRWEPKGDHPASRCGLSGNGPGGQLYGDPAADGAGRTLGPDGADRARSRAAGQSLRYGSAR